MVEFLPEKKSLCNKICNVQDAYQEFFYFEWLKILIRTEVLMGKRDENASQRDMNGF